jgi:hypothetical protein
MDVKMTTDYDTIAPSKLLKYVKKQDLVQFITAGKYKQVEEQLRTELNKEKITLRDVKKFLSAQSDFVDSIKNDALGHQAWEKYKQAVQRMRDPTMIQRRNAVRQGMTQPRRRYLGCLASKLEPDDYKGCLDNYDDEKYERLKLVPSGLKQRVYQNTTDEALRTALGRTIHNPKSSFSDLPTGLRRYIKLHPTEFKNYFDERKYELKLIKSVLKNLSPQDNTALRRHFQQQQNMTFEDFQRLVSSSGEERKVKRRINGGHQTECPFELIRSRNKKPDDDVWTISTNDTSVTDLIDSESGAYRHEDQYGDSIYGDGLFLVEVSFVYS